MGRQQEANIRNTGTLLETGVKDGGRCEGDLSKGLHSVVSVQVNVTFGGTELVPRMATKTKASIRLSEIHDPPPNMPFNVDLFPMINK
jgi:hypothetical protein